MNDFDPTLDLLLYREIPISAEQAWRGWTEPELLVQWFTPKPWRTLEAEIELQPGGIFRTVMAGPDGEVGGGTGCVLEVVPQRRLIWSGAMLPGFRPAPPAAAGEPVFTARIDFEPAGDGCRYAATARHDTPESRAAHEAMGFQTGWGAALDQLVDLMRSLPQPQQ